MTGPELKETVQDLCPGVKKEFVDRFFTRMGEDYLAAFSPAEIAEHIRMSWTLGDDRKIQVRIATKGDREFEIVIAGFDYPAQLSMIAGLLSAFALDIRTGDIYSFSRHAPSSRIVDVFSVSIKPGELFDRGRQEEFERELQTLAHLLGDGSIGEARERLNRFLIERIEKMNEPLSGLLAPVSISFDNEASPEWTVMEVQSEDAFAFLYAISNALSMRGVDINKVTIRSGGAQATDRFFIGNRSGGKIKEGREQERLRLAVSIIKQFTRFLREAPDPAKAMRHFDQFLDKVAEIGEEDFPDRSLSFLTSTEGMSALAHLLGSSDYLWNDFLRAHFTSFLPVLENFTQQEGKTRLPSLDQSEWWDQRNQSLGQRHPSSVEDGRSLSEDLARAKYELQTRLDCAAVIEEKKAILNAFKDEQLFLIDVGHLLGSHSALDDFSHALTDLAEMVLDVAATVSFAHVAEKYGVPMQHDGKPSPFTICALGKFGGREMGYASDLELLFVHDGPAEAAEFFEAFARLTVDLIETREKGIFHIDLRLRPHGDAGTWSTSIERFAKYYSADGGAASFERQALIKLRSFAGNPALGRRVETLRDNFTYSGARWDWEDALEMRRRQMTELVKPGQVNVKYSSGGIVDIEYAVQYLQLLNGKEYPEIRVPTTLEALARLRRLQIVREKDFWLLHSSYLFLRNLIDAMRIVRGDAGDLVLPAEESGEFKALARRLGYKERERAVAAARLSADIRESMAEAHTYFMARFERQPGE